jgi:hypothetical protein
MPPAHRTRHPYALTIKSVRDRGMLEALRELRDRSHRERITLLFAPTTVVEFRSRTACMVTSSMGGYFRDDARTRPEFVDLLPIGNRPPCGQRTAAPA